MLLVGVFLSFLLIDVVSDNEAGAMGGGNPAATIGVQTWRPTQPIGPSLSHRRRQRELRKADFLAGPANCVRLCDGSFFPSNSASGGDATCQAQCPDAPTALYIERAGSDRIEDSVSVSGAPYTDLPVAGRYRTIVDNTCTCHRHKVSYLSAMLQDRTLRKGDAVMTPTGIVVYEGKSAGASRPEDFVALAQDKSLSRDVRENLSRMQSNSIDASSAGKKGAIWVESPPGPSR
jgi:hypothetical protein